MSKPWTALRIIKYLFIFFILVLVVMIFRPITTLHIDDCLSSSGITTKVWAHESSKDVHIRIGDEGRYYINRGLERGISEKEFSEKIMGKEIIIHYADHWTPLDPTGVVRHVARVSHGEDILYDEIVE